MLISFSVENFLSFKKKINFSMVAFSERQHSERVAWIKKYPLKVLPIAAVYGGNASGKSNFIKALSFAQNYIVTGLAPDLSVPRVAFRLDSSMLDKPSRFEFSLLINDLIFEYSFSVDSTRVLFESLKEINSSSEKILFERQGSAVNFPCIRNNKILNFVAKGTRDNVLFLTNSVWQKVDLFKPVYDWFRNNLQIITPNSRFIPVDQLFNESNPLSQSVAKMLRRLDTGIDHLEGQPIELENVLHDENERIQLLSDIKEGQSFTYRKKSQVFVVTKTNGKLQAKRLVALHNDKDGHPVYFGLHEESDGNNRLINLIPAFSQLADKGSKDVFIFDELDRSLHPLLTRTLIENFLEQRNTTSRAQMIFTTHDVSLMDQEIFRRDELWVAERGSDGSSRLYSFSDYELRKDKDIRKSYLEGRLGGLPNILGTACDTCWRNWYEQETYFFS